MRLSTKADHVRELFGQAIVLSGNYRLDECLASLRTALTEDPDFAAGWGLLAYYATDSREAAEALAEAQHLVKHGEALKRKRDLGDCCRCSLWVHRARGAHSLFLSQPL
jgi:predicted Zn-dependent protease